MADKSRRNTNTELKQIYPDNVSAKYDLKSTVVVIPAFDVPSVSATWRDGSCGCWLSSRLPLMLSEPCVLSFEPGLEAMRNGFSWQDTIEYGDLLLEKLLDRDADGKFHEKSLFFIGHSLGGLILKRAMSVLYERFYDIAYQSLLSIISGAVFLGTPAPAINRPRDLK